MVKQLCALT